MRQIVRYEAKDGTVTYRVRYRKGGTYTSQTFRAEADAKLFRDILGNGKADRIAEAEQWLAAKEDEQRIATFGEWFAKWTDELTGIQPRTVADYRAIHRRYLTSLDPLPLPLVTRTHVARVVQELEQAGRSPKTIKHAINLLSTVLSVAMDEGLIARNPVRRVRLPKIRRDPDAYVFLTPQEASALIGAVDPYWRPLVTFLLGTGLRWSEATALQIRHVDLDHGTVRVERAWKRVPGEGLVIGPPKTEAGTRTVNAAVDALLAVQPLTVGRKPSELLFTTRQGNLVRHGNFYNRVWVPACKAAGLTDPRPTPHDCRSTFGSWMLSEGIGLSAVRDQLGHESEETTRRIYAHLLPSVGVEAGKAASAALARALAVATIEGPDIAPLSIQARGDTHQGAQP